MLKSTAKEGEPANGENTFRVGLFQNGRKAFKCPGDIQDHSFDLFAS
jgi:hypothetical protein